MLKYGLSALLLIISLASLATENSNQLSAVNTLISHLTSDLAQQTHSRKELQEQLQLTETSLGDLKKHQQQVNREIRNRQASLAALNKQQAEDKNTLAHLQQQLAQEIRSAYMQEQPNYLKLLLSQKNPAELEQNLAYYQYILTAQQQLILNLNKTVTALEENKQRINDETVQLLSFTNQQQQQMALIQYKHQQRKLVLEQINQTISNKNQHLANLVADKQALEHVVIQLEKKPTPVQPSFTAVSSFPQAKGKLNWPTRGKLMAGFNSSAEGGLKLNGVLLAAAEGQGVYAVAGGKVEFAQWLPGYGLLLIIDHGQSYMTLYGRNASLYKKAGESVAAGDLIATVGKTGGYATPALYFAIRKQGQPLDPARWCGYKKTA